MGGVPRPGLFNPTVSMREPLGWNSPRGLEEAEKIYERGGGTQLVTLDRTKAERNGAGSDRGAGPRDRRNMLPRRRAHRQDQERARSPTALSLPRRPPLVVLQACTSLVSSR